VRPVRIGVQIAQYGASWEALLEAAQTAEAMGVDALFNWDHFFGPGAASEATSFECWTLLAAWAASTTRIALGPFVSCIGYRNPDLLADMARTVDHVSGGRMILGLGSGFKERDYVEYGYRYGTVASRVDDLAHGLERIRLRRAALHPPPIGAMPLLVAGDGERRTLRLVAEYADIWHTFADGEAMAHKIEVLERHCADVGRDPAEIERSALVGPEPEEMGPDLRKLGVTLFIVSVRNLDLSPVHAWLHWRDAENAATS
jgi:probable F420-dependent oxidoreductase